MHHKGVYHLDVKPENILVSKEDFTVKVIDFEFSRTKKDITETALIRDWRNRSLLYMPPEIVKLVVDVNVGKPIAWGVALDWEKVDVFALGVSLFSVMFYTSPFADGKALASDKCYGLAACGKWSEFWEANWQVKQIVKKMCEIDEAITKSLISLVSDMLEYKPRDRPRMKDVVAMEMFKGIK